MTCSTSDVAVCCSSDSKVVVRWRSSLSSRAFSMAITAWAAKFEQQLDLLVCKGRHLSTVDGDNSNDSSSLAALARPSLSVMPPSSTASTELGIAPFNIALAPPQNRQLVNSLLASYMRFIKHISRVECPIADA